MVPFCQEGGSKSSQVVGSSSAPHSMQDNALCEKLLHVPVITVEEVFAASDHDVDFVKLDVEGSEMHILPALLPLMTAVQASLVLELHVHLIGEALSLQLIQLLMDFFPSVFLMRHSLHLLRSPC